MGRPQPPPVCASHRLMWNLDQKRPGRPTQHPRAAFKNASQRCAVPIQEVWRSARAKAAVASTQVDVANAKENSPSFRSIDRSSAQRMAFDISANNEEVFVVLNRNALVLLLIHVPQSAGVVGVNEHRRRASDRSWQRSGLAAQRGRPFGDPD